MSRRELRSSNQEGGQNGNEKKKDLMLVMSLGEIVNMAEGVRVVFLCITFPFFFNLLTSRYTDLTTLRRFTTNFILQRGLE